MMKFDSLVFILPLSPTSFFDLFLFVSCPGKLSFESVGEANSANADDETVAVGAAAGQVILPEEQVSNVRPAVQGAGAHGGTDGEDTRAEV
jgi:hypothetical protein